MNAREIELSDISDLELLHRGKVRDVYAVSDDKLLLIATDRISAFDCILPTPISGKGKILTQLSAFWFDHLKEVTANHLISTDTADMPDAVRAIDDLSGRSTLVY